MAVYEVLAGMEERIIANLSVIPGPCLYLFVGGQGSWSSSSPYGAGYNPEGAGGYSTYYGGGGGGALQISG